jgi:hypothetical protein
VFLVQVAKITASKMLMMWKKMHEEHSASSDESSAAEQRSESRSLFYLSENGAFFTPFDFCE